MNPMITQAEIDAAKDNGIRPCDYCRVDTDTDVLFTHEPTSHQLCQDCLAAFLETDIADSDDHRGRFQGWEFRKAGNFYEASTDGGGYLWAGTMGELVEQVLMKTGII